MRELELTPSEIELVTFVGVRRAIQAKVAGRSRLTNLPGATGGSDAVNDVEGCAAEYAVAKAANRFWNALADNVSKDVLKADVGDDIHVKAITKSHHNLIVKPDDPRFGTYILCEVMFPKIRLVGAFPARMISEEDWDSSLPAPTFCIKRSRLLGLREAVIMSKEAA